LQFRLRTLLLITTATAVYLGVNLALYRTLGSSGSIFGGPMIVQSLFRLPLFLVWLAAALWVYAGRDRLKCSGMVLMALVVLMAWNMVAEPLYMVVAMRLTLAPGTIGQMLMLALTLISLTVSIGGWVVLFVAYARSNEGRVGRAAPEGDAEEISGPLSLVRD
jgi:hypothetical protein